MTSTAPARQASAGELAERIVIHNDLTRLSPADRIVYYRRLCESLGLNPLTWPFRFLYLDGRLTLYTTRDACDQLRAAHHVSIGKPTLRFEPGLLIVEIEASLPNGRSDADVGVVALTDKEGKDVVGLSRANAVMKAVTKAKRRVTLSIVGLGLPDESEVEDIPGARRIVVDHETGEIEAPVATDAAAEHARAVTSEDAPTAEPEPEPAPSTTRPAPDPAVEEREGLIRALTAWFNTRKLGSTARAQWLREKFGDVPLERVDLALLKDAVDAAKRRPAP